MPPIRGTPWKAPEESVDFGLFHLGNGLLPNSFHPLVAYIYLNFQKSVKEKTFVYSSLGKFKLFALFLPVMIYITLYKMLSGFSSQYCVASVMKLAN